MAVNDIYDLIVIGAGPGGSAAAIKAADALGHYYLCDEE